MRRYCAYYRVRGAWVLLLQRIFRGAMGGTEGPLKAHVALPYRGQTSCGTACCVTLLPQAASGVVHVTLLQLLALAN